MIHAAALLDLLGRHGVAFYAGVPDSLLKDLCACITDSVPAERHVIAANEGGAVALAAGHHLATGRVGLVYMQNSGLGNALNPLISLADSQVYGVPMLLLVGWRGEPGLKDEPQHVKQGAITLPLFDAMGTPYRVLPDDLQQAAAVVDEVMVGIRASRAPAALVVRKGTFHPWTLRNKARNPHQLRREDAIIAIASGLDERDVVVATTGKASRELFDYRARQGLGHQRDFLTVGAMGHASQIALAIAMARPQRRVICLDGDGAAIMHLGGLAIAGTREVPNFRHVILNNGAHESVGGQPTAALDIDLGAIARACGYGSATRASSAAELKGSLDGFLARPGPSLLEVMLQASARSDLGRPTTTPAVNKQHFMAFVGEGT